MNELVADADLYGGTHRVIGQILRPRGVLVRHLVMPGQGDEGLFTDPVLTLDVSARATVRPGVDVYVNGRNLTDDRAIMARLPFGARTQPPRWIQAGIELSY